jgi:hypothetical protein
MEVVYPLGGEQSYLTISEDGTVVYIQEKGLRPPGAKPIRIRREGQVTKEEVSNLIEFFKESRFDELSESYQFPGKPMSDMRLTVPGVLLVVEENVTRFPSSTRKIPTISPGQAIEIANKLLGDRVATVVARGDVRAELHGWYWEVVFNNVNATYDELNPVPLKPPPPGVPASKAYPGVYQSVVITVDAETGDPLSAGASKAPKPGPYVSREQAISSAREYMTRVPAEAWIEKASVEAYLRGDVWIVLFWEEGSSIKDRSSALSVHRFRVSVDAVIGTATGASRG